MIWYGAWLKWMHMPFLMSAVDAISLKFWQRYGIALRRHCARAVKYLGGQVIARHDQHSGGTYGGFKFRAEHRAKPGLAFGVEVVAGLVQKEQGRIRAYGHGEEQALALATRQGFEGASPHGVGRVQVGPGAAAPRAKLPVQVHPLEST